MLIQASIDCCYCCCYFGVLLSMRRDCGYNVVVAIVAIVAIARYLLLLWLLLCYFVLYHVQLLQSLQTIRFSILFLFIFLKFFFIAVACILYFRQMRFVAKNKTKNKPKNERKKNWEIKTAVTTTNQIECQHQVIFVAKSITNSARESCK